MDTVLRQLNPVSIPAPFYFKSHFAVYYPVICPYKCQAVCVFEVLQCILCVVLINCVIMCVHVPFITSYLISPCPVKCEELGRVLIRFSSSSWQYKYALKKLRELPVLGCCIAQFYSELQNLSIIEYLLAVTTNFKIFNTQERVSHRIW